MSYTKSSRNVGTLLRVGPNLQGTNKRGDALAGMERSALPATADAGGGNYRGGGKAPGRNIGRPPLPGVSKPVAPARQFGVGLSKTAKAVKEKADSFR